MTDFSPDNFRQAFPAMEMQNVYLDSASTALKPQPVIDATMQYYRQSLGTVHRSQFSYRLTERYESTREDVAAFINAPSPENIVWTSGTTEAINMVAQGWLRPRLQPGDEILVSEAEHHSNLVPWLMLAQQTGAQVIRWPLARNHLPDMRLLDGLLNEKTRLLALGQMSNVTGGRPDLEKIVALAHKVGAKVMVDGAQGIVHTPPDVQHLDIDFYAFSAHKLYGPTGLGVLFGKADLLSAMTPWKGGGKMLTSVDFNGFIPEKVPRCFEAGTTNTAGVLGLRAALKWLKKIDIASAERWSCYLANCAEEQLIKIPGFRSFRCQQSSILSFDITGIHHSDLATLLLEKGIFLRAGQHCAQPLMMALEVKGLLRASFAPYNNLEDVAAFVGAVKSSVSFFARNLL